MSVLRQTYLFIGYGIQKVFRHWKRCWLSKGTWCAAGFLISRQGLIADSLVANSPSLSKQPAAVYYCQTAETHISLSFPWEEQSSISGRIWDFPVTYPTNHPGFHWSLSRLIDFWFSLMSWAEKSGSGNFKHMDFHTVLEVFRSPEQCCLNATFIPTVDPVGLLPAGTCPAECPKGLV